MTGEPRRGYTPDILAIDEILKGNYRNGIGIPVGVDLRAWYRTPAEQRQAYFDSRATDAHPWSIDDALPDYVLADRGSQPLQFPRWSFGRPPQLSVEVQADVVPIESEIRRRLAEIAIPTTAAPWSFRAQPGATLTADDDVELWTDYEADDLPPLSTVARIALCSAAIVAVLILAIVGACWIATR
ncbi:hypothetical protein ACQ856_18285 [Mycolicibacterium psychrotolerans]|uniref:hypothetical protein n=1 Tax=Mycolicibacterium psychrotolerans TaxID=216929 RepID=UPI003D66FE54